MKRVLLVGLFLGSLAAAQTVTDQFKTTLQPQRFSADVITSQRLGARDVNVDGGLKLSPTGSVIRTSYQGSRSYDFGALGGGAANQEDSFPITVTGALMGHFCTPASNFGMDGGATLNIEASMSCYVSAPGFAKVRMQAARADAGTLDLPDAGYSVITFGP